MELVIVCHGLAALWLDWQSRLSAVERLDLAFLVKREHHGKRWRIEIEAPGVESTTLRSGSSDPGSQVSAAADRS